MKKRGGCPVMATTPMVPRPRRYRVRFNMERSARSSASRPDRIESTDVASERAVVSED
jgi:hypothetical protein